ncbi:cop9 signalosome complex subunit 3 [Anaeramoeba flamelloides]|uniref:COP9 signalosome complex subunit 3 n=1 Tax=Anaeramoeba flamelloides TaxID=1746091 RepID=A0ABQ8Z3X5_9EUKA|nr:cop9 signalosome complex subunit 3 [Anaeramoeba flamelloides]
MEQVQNIIFQNSNNKESLQHLFEFLKKNENIINEQKNNLDLYLEQLHNGHHTLGCIFLLAAKAQSKSIKNVGLIIKQLQQFFLNCDPYQARFCPSKYYFLCRRLAEICIENSVPQAAIFPLYQSIKKLQKTSELTPAHPYLMLVSLCSKNFSVATKVLEEEVFEIESKTTGLNIEEVLLYFYYGGLIWTILKKYDRATHFFELNISFPADILSKIVLESYKKYIFTSILSTGKVPVLPSQTSHVVEKNLRQLCGPYFKFKQFFENSNSLELNELVVKFNDIFEKDNNLGLAKLCIQNLLRRGIQRLTKTYITLSLEFVADKFGLGSVTNAEFYILDMIEKGEVFAKIDQKKGEISFHDDPETYQSSQIGIQMDKEIQEVIDLSNQIKHLDEKIMVYPNYIMKKMKEDHHSQKKSEEIETEKMN